MHELAAGRPQNPSFRGKVLIVDDNLEAGESLSALLQALDFDAHAVHGGPAALSMLARFKPDVVVCDIGMPGMDGYAVARKIRAVQGPESPLLVAYTGYGNTVDATLSHAAGFSHHLTKGSDFACLLGLLEASCRTRDAS